MRDREPENLHHWHRPEKESEGRREALCRSRRQVELLVLGEYGIAELHLELEEDPPCRCVRIDVDVDDGRDCPVHGRDSALEDRGRQQEADRLAAYYARSAFDGEGPAT
jgi:hypothetical protein